MPTGSPPPRFAELSAVTLARAVEVDGASLPPGATGTVVAAYADGIGYEVEFDLPFQAVVTVTAADLVA